MFAADGASAPRAEVGAGIEADRFFTLSLDLMCVAGIDGYFKRVNPAFSATLGWTAEELCARSFLDFVHPDDRDATLREVEKLAAGQPVLQFDNRYRHKDGSWRVLSWRTQPQPDGTLYATARDVTVKRQLQLELRRHADALEAANRELDAFSYSVSHDLRAPLRHMSGFAALLEQLPEAAALSDQGRRYIRTIVEAAAKMGRLIDELLEFSRMGRASLARSRVDLNQIARDAQREIAAACAGREIIWCLGELPVVEGDPAMLRLVLLNLLSNAAKYSSTRDRSEIEVGIAPGDPDEWVIFVRDNGVGFDPQYAGKLFGVFQRLHHESAFEGTGVGLANVRRIVARHGGRTWAEGALNQGATFYFSLPRDGGEPHGDPVEAHPAG